MTKNQTGFNAGNRAGREIQSPEDHHGISRGSPPHRPVDRRSTGLMGGPAALAERRPPESPEKFEDWLRRAQPKNLPAWLLPDAQTPSGERTGGYPRTDQTPKRRRESEPDFQLLDSSEPPKQRRLLQRDKEYGSSQLRQHKAEINQPRTTGGLLGMYRPEEYLPALRSLGSVAAQSSHAIQKNKNQKWELPWEFNLINDVALGKCQIKRENLLQLINDCHMPDFRGNY
jgi:hypothetical protein